MTTTPLLTSRTVGETENALRGLLTRTLSGTGLDYHRWVALLVTNTQAPIPASHLAAQLRGGLKIDESTADEVIGDLQAHGLIVEHDARLGPTAEGSALFARINAEVRQLTQRLYAGIDHDDLAAAYRVLSTLTQRANALLAT
jgi:DNA-binding MarR family transcriptional regulator